MSEPATNRELLVFEAARRVHDGECVIVGTGLPLLAALVAQRTHAPRVQLIIESGVVFPTVLPTPMSVVDPRLMHAPSRLGSLLEVLGGFVQRGLVDVGFLGGAQVDERANINSTWVEGDDGKRRRLPGSGGANDIASSCRRLVVLMSHERRRFPARCDFVTSPGFLSGPGARRAAGLPPMSVTVLTDLCVLEGDDDEGRLRLAALMPGVSVDDVLDRMQFVPVVPEDVAVVSQPPASQLDLLREVLDPDRRYFPEAAGMTEKA
ncbi:MAG: glutaconate CoA-transferase [Actinomycetota bacterium]|nr:glutaconate CoA-transferase [Actinomycetota bacterium]